MFKVLDEACRPKRATKFSSCIDLCAREDVVIGAGETKVVPLGVKIDLKKLKQAVGNEFQNLTGYELSSQLTPDGDSDIVLFDAFMASHCLELKCRSSLPLKKGLIIANGVGEIDLDYVDSCRLGKEINKGYCNKFKPKSKEK